MWKNGRRRRRRRRNGRRTLDGSVHFFKLYITFLDDLLVSKPKRFLYIRIEMSLFPLVLVNRVFSPCRSSSFNWPNLFSNRRRLDFQVGKISSLVEGHWNLSSFYHKSQFPSLRSSRKSRLSSKCNRITLAKVDRSKERHTQFGIEGKPRSRRQFSLRLRPRLRLLSDSLKRFTVQQFTKNARIALNRNAKKLTLSVWFSLVLGLFFVFLKYTSRPASVDVPYSEFVSNLQSGSVSAVQFEEDSRYIYFNRNSDDQTVAEGLSLAADDLDVHAQGSKSTSSVRERGGTSILKWRYSTRRINHDESFLLGLMREKGTAYSSAPQSAHQLLRSLVMTSITLWIPLAPMVWLLYRQFYSGNSHAKKRRPSKQSVSFDDVEGVDSAKLELMEIVSCLQGTINYKKLGAKLPRGILLVGPPGTGKTLLARSVAGEAGVPFFSVSASEFVELFVGRGAARVRDLFNVAKECSPSIVFIDELDAVGGKRGRSFNDERDQTLNQLLTEMDGFESDTKVIVIAATNRPEALDPALCRPGRFSRKVLVGEPDFEGRKKILAVHLRQVPLDEEIEIICDLIASLTTGLVGADLANIINEAALLAARRAGAETVTRDDMMEAVERAKFGINQKRSSPMTISKSLAKLFPWMLTSIGKDGFQGLMGYQTLS
ncbi:probable inactive ATP-dependent zinc metalloprotease FTSHI 3, chloroplastic isoform X4 [Zingiber officinale]|uniref:probable inactive ATP-dependent zinc metalloprotease FTSHI 3, chloroplastic isoform X4 n=1 Tax=Zingiber officinale TaxID=94328 RepID=UPI001C4D608D|nr:probable inactive ATP-dependent zinc metalloprotease FTSHI 3, chloroplastic isoform X4 [Zingiber officinale]